jgi:hypothetical protein
MGLKETIQNALLRNPKMVEEMQKVFINLECESEVTKEKIKFMCKIDEKLKIKQFFQNIENKYKKDVKK